MRVEVGSIVKLNNEGIRQFPYLRDVLLEVREICTPTLFTCSPLSIFVPLIASRYRHSDVYKHREYNFFIGELVEVESYDKV